MKLSNAGKGSCNASQAKKTLEVKTLCTKELNLNIEIDVPEHFAVVGVINTRNGCCKDKPYLLTVNKTEVSKEWPVGLNYSCQCACGLWCTNGHGTPEAAIAEYERMSKSVQRN